MNSPRKSQDLNQIPEINSKEDFARRQCVESIFSEHFGEDQFLLFQVKRSIEDSIDENMQESSIEVFCQAAINLYQNLVGTPPSYGFIYLDFSGKTWDPLFASEELTRQLKRVAGFERVFLIIKNLSNGIKPDAKYNTKAIRKVTDEATGLIENLTAKWSTPSSTTQILFL